MRLRLFLLPLVSVLALSAVTRAESPKPPRSFDVAAIDAYVAALVLEQGTPGLALTIMRDGKMVLAKGYGKRSLEDGAPVEPDTPFAVGSVTKQFACACVLLLAEEGKLSVDDKVAESSRLTRAGEITLVPVDDPHFGIPRLLPARLRRPPDAEADRGRRSDQGVRRRQARLRRRARWSYSNTGYLILGRVVEKVSGEPFGPSSTGASCPAGMKDTAFEPGAGSRAGPGATCPLPLVRWSPRPPEADGWVHAAGSLWASAPDLARWGLALIEGRVLKPESFRLMTSPVARRRPAKDYGCGLSVLPRDGETVLRMDGAVSGFRAYGALIARTRSALVLLTNGEPTDPALPQTHSRAASRGQKATRRAARRRTARPAGGPRLSPPDAGGQARPRHGLGRSSRLSHRRADTDAAPRLKALGEPERVEVQNVRERGGWRSPQFASRSSPPSLRDCSTAAGREDPAAPVRQGIGCSLESQQPSAVMTVIARGEVQAFPPTSGCPELADHPGHPGLTLQANCQRAGVPRRHT